MFSRTAILPYHTGQLHSIGTANPNLRVQPMKGFTKWLLYIENTKLYLHSDFTKSNEKLQLEFVIANQELSLDSVYIKIKPKTRVVIGETFKAHLVLEGLSKIVEHFYRERSTQFTVIVTEDGSKSISFRKAKKEVVMNKGSISRIIKVNYSIEKSQRQNQKAEEEGHFQHSVAETNNALPLTLCLVVNVVDPIKGERRDESLRTTESINQTFSNIANWQIKGLINPTKKHFFDDIKEFLQDPLRRYDQIVSIIMSHGDLKSFSLTDGNIVHTELVKSLIKYTRGRGVIKVLMFTNCLTSDSKEDTVEMRQKILSLVEETNNLLICFPCAPGEVSSITETKKKECHNLYIHTFLKRFKKELATGRVIHLEDIIKGAERRVKMVNIIKKPKQNECNVKEDEQIFSEINSQIPWSEGNILKNFVCQEKPYADGHI